jgi:hypothetical protein
MSGGQAMSLKTIGKRAIFASLALALTGLAGCGVDDIQLNGKIFDAVGINTGSVKSAEPTMKTRAPLVVPPGLETALPVPGSGKAEAPVLADVQDHDAVRQLSKDDLAREQAAFCKKNYEEPKARGDDSADSVEGPAGPCRGSVFSAIKALNGGGESDDE